LVLEPKSEPNTGCSAWFVLLVKWSISESTVTDLFAAKWLKLGEENRIALRIPDLQVFKVVPIVYQKVTILDFDRIEALSENSKLNLATL
jgi:hypothetical protein